MLIGVFLLLSMLTCSILTIGDEICIGQIVNSNAAWMAAQCTKIGCEVMKHVTVSDNEDEILAELENLRTYSDFILITGGLGPTHDDITKKVLCSYFQDELIWHAPTLEWLEEFARIRNRVLTDRNRQQALLPSKCTVLTNKNGTAPGMLFTDGGSTFVSMPGVPREMMYIMENHVLPLLEKIISENGYETNKYRTILTIGIAESDLADLIGDETLFLKENTSLAFLPSYKGVRLRIGVHNVHANEADKLLDSIEEYLHSKAGKYFFGKNDESIESVTARLLKEQGATVSVAESCTGGKIGAAFTEMAGSSAYFIGGVLAYSNDVKVQELSVNVQDIEKYGAVSEQVARSMSEGVRKKLSTTYALSATGTAGPGGGTEEKPVGTVWISLATPKETIAKRFIFGNDRTANRERTVGAAFDMLYRYLRSEEK